ncbi:MAG: LamG domain-containing protein [Sedimentisphaerales bacterium]
MSNRVRFTILLAVLGMICPTAWAALWNPNGTDLTFNLNFETNTTSPNPTTTDAKANLVGRAYDYNSVDTFRMWDSNTDDKMIGNYVGDFRAPSDMNTGKDYDCRVKVGPNTPLTTPAYNHLFDLGTYSFPVTRTFTCWFNVSDLTKGTMFRHANADDVNYPNNYWEIKIYDGKLRFEHKLSILDMSTMQTLSDMGIQPNTWHHVAMTYDVYNDSTRVNNKIYVDGVEVDRVIDDYKYYLDADIDTQYRSPVEFGAGEKEFDGLLDEFRVYGRVLTASEISILYQTDGKPHPFALSPYPNASRVAVTTNLQWEPNMAGAAAQSLYFGTDPCNFGAAKKNGDGSMNSATNGEISGPLALGTTYYWDVNATVGGNMIQGPVWKFTTEDGKAYNPTPTNSQQDVNFGIVDLKWSGCPSATSYDVYFSNNQSLVASNDPSVKVKSGLVDADPNYVVSAPLSAENYYWRIVSKLSGVGYPDVNSDVWSFRTKPYPIVFNTDDGDVAYEGQVIPGYTCMVRDSFGVWSTISTGRFDANDIEDVNDGLTIIFDFNGFNYTNRYEIIAVPWYGQDEEVNKIPTSLCIDVNGNFYFDGRIDISGESTSTIGDSEERDWPMARCGGYRGGHRNGYASTTDYDSNFITKKTYDQRLSVTPTVKNYWIGDPNTAYKLYGPGMGITVSESGKEGGGGGYGGMGGDSGRGYFHCIFAGGPTYGDKEVPVAFGGSAGGWGAEMWGGAGGGGIEIIANGNVTLDSNSIVRAEGGSVILPSAAVKYSGGGGAGGSVKIIAGGSVAIKGVIDVNGGKGGDNSTTDTGNAKPNNTSGGGGGGRVAVFYGTTYTNTGSSITAKGGAKGVVLPTSSNGYNWDKSLAEDGQDGTIFSSNGSPRKASAPTPKNGDSMVYAPSSPTALTLKWYSGYNVTAANDVVYFDQSTNPTTKAGEVPATRGQHGVSVNVYPNQTYYFKVITTVGSVSSDVWSFHTVGWKCLAPDACNVSIGEPLNHGWPAWDIDHDCVVSDADFWYFAKDWAADRGGGSPNAYLIDFVDLYNYAQLWLECRGRTDNGCVGW